jgi:ferritin-like metal-binding protein YciE
MISHVETLGVRAFTLHTLYIHEWRDSFMLEKAYIKALNSTACFANPKLEHMLVTKQA